MKKRKNNLMIEREGDNSRENICIIMESEWNAERRLTKKDNDSREMKDIKRQQKENETGVGKRDRR